MTKKILLQCQSITYFYMGLAAIFTKYPNRDVQVDVVLTRDGSDAEEFLEILRKSKYINRIIYSDLLDLKQVDGKIYYLKKNLLGFIKSLRYKRRMVKIIKKYFEESSYSDIVFCHELTYHLMAHLKSVYKNANFIMYGDGSGLLSTQLEKLIDPYCEVHKPHFIQNSTPNEIISLSPYIEDGSNDFDDLPVTAIDRDIFIDLFEKDTEIQKDIIEYSKYIQENFQNKKISLLLASRLYDPRFLMNEKEQEQIYVDMVEKYCSKGSVVILKNHPVSTQDLASVLNERLKDDYEFIELPQSLKQMPIEICKPILEQLETVITFLSSSRVSLKYLYDTNITDGYEVIQNYNLKERVNPFLDVYEQVVNRIDFWDKKSIIYKTDIIPALKEFYDKYANLK